MPFGHTVGGNVLPYGIQLQPQYGQPYGVQHAQPYVGAPPQPYIGAPPPQPYNNNAKYN